MFGKWVEWEFRWVEKAGWVKDYVPKIPKMKYFRHFNFIVLHCKPGPLDSRSVANFCADIYLIFLIILGSVMVYGVGGIQYIDALFFASGAATQSGLNTVDVNNLYLYQQIVLVFISCISNPIWINTMVVFIRLYWFEKRFQNVARDARAWRRTRTKSRTRSEMRRSLDHDEERGVAGREIHVVRAPNGHANMNEAGSPQSRDFEEHAPNATEPRPGSPAIETPSTFQRDIMFADEVRPSRRDNLDRVPQRRTKEESIAFVENQRNLKDQKVLRVPGPRDFDRGERPHEVDEEDETDLDRTMSGDGDDTGEDRLQEKRSGLDDPDELNADDHPEKSEANGGHHLKWLPDLSNILLPKRSRTDVDNGESNMQLHKRGRSATFRSFLSAKSQERADRDPMPYLSYTATIGRNSLFVDLSEDEREELGGVEYRALKTLAWILTCKVPLLI